MVPGDITIYTFQIGVMIKYQLTKSSMRVSSLLLRGELTATPTSTAKTTRVSFMI